MGLNDTPSAERIHIGFFGLRNAGKSSLVNRIANQDISVVSEVKGTTTDPVRKTMELLPLGAVVIIDTPGYDDVGALGELRVNTTKKVLDSCDIAVLVTENTEISPAENELIGIFGEKKIPYIVAHNKSDINGFSANTKTDIYVSATDNRGIEELKEAIGKNLNIKAKTVKLVADFISEGDTVILVTPIDASAPKGRMILPQQQAIRDIIDHNSVCVVVQVGELAAAINNLKNPPALVVTDSQAFKEVAQIVPREIPLTSFSILLARYKGFLDIAVKGAHEIDKLKDGAKILVSEGCTHHRQCEDIGTVKLPKLLKKFTGKEFDFTFSSGHGFPDNLEEFDLILHCGACMLGDKEVMSRMNKAGDSGVPITNYGTAIAHMNGILDRSIEVIYK
ncbi:MAG: [Eubacterium sp.]|nr:[FeFe] hydrogenase H-cluster maturation GTPase HydF [Eubacterium sp.]